MGYGTTGDVTLKNRAGTDALYVAANTTNVVIAGCVAVKGATLSTSTALIVPASTTAVSSLRIPSGTAPTSPISGDLWYDGTNLVFRDGSTTRLLQWV
jgi:hypothetical protein